MMKGSLSGIVGSLENAERQPKDRIAFYRHKTQTFTVASRQAPLLGKFGEDLQGGFKTLAKINT